MVKQVYFKIILPSLLFFLGCNVSAQSKFIDHVKSQKTGEGKVIINQSPLIDDVVNNIPKPAKKAETPTPPKAKPNEDKKHEQGEKPSETKPKDSPTRNHAEGNNEHTPDYARISGTRQRYKATGYRIQIFTGSNSHSDKMKAYSIGENCQRRFPMLSVYPRFINPRWVCRVGDFRTHEDAQEYAKKIRAARITKEVRIVRCEVLLAR